MIAEIFSFYYEDQPLTFQIDGRHFYYTSDHPDIQNGVYVEHFDYLHFSNPAKIPVGEELYITYKKAPLNKFSKKHRTFQEAPKARGVDDNGWISFMTILEQR